MGLAEDLKSEVAAVFREVWSTRKGQVVPDTPDLKMSNDGVELEATVLYADIDGSTSMVDANPPQFAAEVYKTYLLCAARLIKSEGGVITAYDGDRVMAVFIGGSKNSSAVRCGLKIKAAVTEIINPAIKNQYNSDFQLRQVVGIDTSQLLVARTGIRGSNDLVWVGPAANHAAKLSGISEPLYSTYISAAVYARLSEDAKIGSDGKNMWEERAWQGKTIYRSHYYWHVPNS
ncbi:Adenylate cyclase, class 3 [Bryocella elongata]|uniref:Adenylate cyclase, class 3 n=1 Tax=Bryocella elongata TaxID=863522 RepID=A0A1H5Z5K6_9BACT|nr:adenylate/guanylate cyclase domain-containing protein [Bryocella elongata]SEG31809.1 Adenylate cyclase, class 3 [Bryocella elongata]